MPLNVNVNANRTQQPHEQTPQFFLGENVHVCTKSDAHLSNSSQVFLQRNKTFNLLLVLNVVINVKHV